MDKQDFPELPAGRVAGGGRTLRPGRALSLRPDAAGVLQISRGLAWVTVKGTRRTPGQALGDHFLHAGECLRVDAGQHLVLEATGATALDFDWQVLGTGGSRWQGAVMQPLRDLRLALRLLARALGQLLLGLAGYGEYLVAGRGRVMPTLEANQP